ncbi:helix-turn-helix domain-containing protein [Deinococcus sp. NW-56]|uniref:helix-turn-helix domain-containing protein n=1 Tax=Deinococcus sp. NW-56 TaxID=2080419 RepID=UPI000CF385E8|nr:helix-turn-helix domain-containing protein [Deinococcus sp. NW-56]
MTPYFYEPRELAELLRVSETTIRRMIRRGTLRAVAIGRQHRVPRSELVRLILEAGLSVSALPPSLQDLIDMLHFPERAGGEATAAS